MPVPLFTEGSNMRKAGSVIKHAAALLATLLVLAVLSGILFKPKFLNDNYWPLDVTYQSFYEMENDSVDAVFLGSSHAISAFSPQELYDTCGIRSFNLASEEQSLLVSYYWLKEALRFQKPQAVVLDTVVCFPFMDTPYNCNEASIRKAIDPMKWSSVKLDAVRTIGSLDPEETFVSYLFPIIRYHARWSDLSANDIRFWPKQNTSLKGYAVLSEDTTVQDYKPLAEKDNVTPAGMHGVMKDYLDRITELCKENGITLILVNTPYLETTNEVHQAVADYAQEHGIRYIDFNEETCVSEMGFVFSSDMADAGHANNFGAVKLTDYIGAVLLEEGVSQVQDDQYENSRAYCLRQLKNANLYRINSFGDYYSAIDPADYMIFVSGSGEEAAALMGLEAAGPFTALIENGSAKIMQEPYKEYRLKENIRFRMESEKDRGVIRVHDMTYERSGEGLQIVLLDREKGYVIDHSVFDLSGQRIQ